jgi:hypothetical protein
MRSLWVFVKICQAYLHGRPGLEAELARALSFVMRAGALAGVGLAACTRMTRRSATVIVPIEGETMPIRKPTNPDLAKAVDSLSDAAQHVRNAVEGKVEQVRGAAAAELAKAKAVARSKTGLAQEKVEAVLNKAEARLHKVIAKAQKALDKIVRQAEKHNAAPKAAASAKKAAANPTAGKAVAKKASPVRKAVPAKK